LAEQERVANIPAAHHARLSVREIAGSAAVPRARSPTAARAGFGGGGARDHDRWESSETQASAGSETRRLSRSLLRESTEWLDQLIARNSWTVKLSEATDPQTEYVAADRTQVRQVLLEIAGEIEGLAAVSTPANDASGALRRERLASLLPNERAVLRRQFRLEP